MSVKTTIGADGEERLQAGRQDNQKVKPFLIRQYLKDNSNKDNLITTAKLATYLTEDAGISAEMHSITRDIKALNIAILMSEEGYTLEEAEEAAEDKETAPIITVPKRGYYYNYQKYDVSNLKILADLIAASPFIADSKVEELTQIVCDLLPASEADKIVKSSSLGGRVRTTNKSVLNNISTINLAMRSVDEEGNDKEPSKISFKAVQYKLNSVKNQVDKYPDKRTVASPFGIFINNGNYYMLGYSDTNHHVIAYRIDRMRDVRILNEPREGQEAIEDKGGIQAYADRRFSIQNAPAARVQLEFSNHCLERVIDRLGTKDVNYYLGSDRENTFGVSIAAVELTDDFFGWIFSLGKSAKILTPDVAQKYASRLEEVKKLY